MPTYPFKKRDTMRRFRLFLFAVLLMLTASVQAQTLRDSSNRNIGKVESDGTIRNSSNSCIGHARGISQRQAAAFFFFNMF